MSRFSLFGKQANGGAPPIDKFPKEQVQALMNTMKGKIPVMVFFDPQNKQVAVQASMPTEETKRVVLMILAEAVKAVVSHNPSGLVKPSRPLPPPANA